MKHLPNILTLLRILLTPVFLMLVFINKSPVALIWAWVIFVFAALTDWLDGVIARKYKLISSFGKIADPLADKFIVLSALAALTWAAPYQVFWLFFAIIALREVMVSILREVYAKKQIIIPADNFGKLKTILQMIGIVVFLGLWAFGMKSDAIILSCNVWFWVITLITLYSGLNYMFGTGKS